MIEVKFDKDCLIVTGHAGYAEYGKDIVCAGVTALVQSLILSIIALTDDKPHYSAQQGAFRMKVKNLSDKSKFLVDSFFIGVKGISEEYPEHVKII